MKKTGILMPVSALPSRTGVGELGEAAYQWIEMMGENLADFASKSSGIWKFPLSALFLMCRG